MSRAAVLGRPVAHSLSPALHNAAYAALGLDWTYTALDCGEADLPGVLAERRDWAGFSCTMPLKRAALDVAAEVSAVAEAIGSANTLLPGPRGWIAENTDVHGVLGALSGVELARSSVAILGAGGTAQAVVAALAAARVEQCTVLVRDPQRTSAVAATASKFAIRADFVPIDVASQAWSSDVLISTLPPGAADPYVRRLQGPRQTLLDVIYAPWPTALAAAAQDAGATVIGGAEMLLHQAARQVELMTGHAAPLEAMRAALG